MSSAVILGLGLTAVATLADLGGPDRPENVAAAPVTTAVAFPGTPPDGVGKQVSWTSPVLAAEAPVVVAPAGDAQVVVFASADGALSGVDAASGAARWAVTLPEGDLVRGPGRGRVADQDAIVVQVSDRVLAFSVTDGSALADAQIPDGGRLALDGPAPLVHIGDDRADVLDGSGFHTVDLPAGARALLARGDGSVLAADARGWWHLTATTPAGEPTPWEQMGSTSDAPAYAPQVVAAVGDSVVLVDADPARPRLFVHEDGDAVRASFQADYTPAPRPVWAPSPAGTWGILGRSLVDVSAGEVTDLGDWETVLVADDRAYGLIGDALYVAGPGRRPVKVTTRTALVEATTRTDAVVRADTPDGPRIWLMRRSSP